MKLHVFISQDAPVRRGFHIHRRGYLHWPKQAETYKQDLPSSQSIWPGGEEPGIQHNLTVMNPHKTWTNVNLVSMFT